MEGLHETPDKHDQLVEGFAAGSGHRVRPLIDDAVWLERVTPAELDALLAHGWRHFGPYFFRYSVTEMNGAIAWIEPLRVRVADFAPSRGQRRILGKNRDLEVTTAPARIDREREDLFARHATRFRENVPESLEMFIPDGLPCECVEIAVRLEGRLVAASYLDVGRESVSSVYGMFDPELARRSLGIFTMLCEIEWAVGSGKRYYYPGYGTESKSAYDYKKRFAAQEVFDWFRWRDAS